MWLFSVQKRLEITCGPSAMQSDTGRHSKAVPNPLTALTLVVVKMNRLYKKIPLRAIDIHQPMT